MATLIAEAAAAGVVPTSKGSPAAAVVTIGMAEAERVAADQSRRQSRSLAEAALAAGGAPAAHIQGSDTTLGDAAARFVLCAHHTLTGVLAQPRTGPGHGDATTHTATALATALGLAPLLPLAESRAQRCFTPAQRKAMALVTAAASSRAATFRQASAKPTMSTGGR